MADDPLILSIINEVTNMRTIQDRLIAVENPNIGTGTSYPTSPRTNMLFIRTDLNNQIFAYDGTIWRGLQIDNGSSFPATATLPDGYQFYRSDKRIFFTYNSTYGGFLAGTFDSGTAFPSTTNLPTYYPFLRTDKPIPTVFIWNGTFWAPQGIDNGTSYPSTTGLPNGYLFLRTDKFLTFSWNGTTWLAQGTDSGTSFPSTTGLPTGYLFNHTTKKQVYTWNGTNWLGTTSAIALSYRIVMPYTVTNSTYAYFILPTDVQLVDWSIWSAPQATNNASNYWSILLISGANTFATQSTAAMTAGTDNFTQITSFSPNPAVKATYGKIDLRASFGAGSPGSLYVGSTLRVQEIGG